MRKKRLGKYLEWHGNLIRVRVPVPSAKRAKVGKAHIKVPLHTSDPREAEVLKGPIVARIFAEFEGVKLRTTPDDTKRVEKALLWKDAIAQPDDGPASVNPRSVFLDVVIEPLIEQGKPAEAAHLLAIADGRATPIAPLIDRWVAANHYTGHTEAKARHSLSVLEKWCKASDVLFTFENINQSTGAKFIEETYRAKKVNSNTANDHISWITRFWKWADNAAVYQGANFWPKLRIENKVARRQGEADKPKRPFTDDEVKALIVGLSGQGRDATLRDFIAMAALTGMRAGEIVALAVGDVANGSIVIKKGKTRAASRTFPVHSELRQLIARRSEGKEPSERLFHDLPGSEGTKRRRGSALSQAFTRYRRKLKIGEAGANSRQDTTDMHSFRRWFIAKARDALAEGTVGYTAWTIADVVGHSTEDEPLGLTMVAYPGEASLDQKKACIEAVRLPSGCGSLA